MDAEEAVNKFNTHSPKIYEGMENKDYVSECIRCKMQMYHHICNGKNCHFECNGAGLFYAMLINHQPISCNEYLLYNIME